MSSQRTVFIDLGPPLAKGFPTGLTRVFIIVTLLWGIRSDAFFGSS